MKAAEWVYTQIGMRLVAVWIVTRHLMAALSSAIHAMILSGLQPGDNSAYQWVSFRYSLATAAVALLVGGVLWWLAGTVGRVKESEPEHAAEKEPRDMAPSVNLITCGAAILGIYFMAAGLSSFFFDGLMVVNGMRDRSSLPFGSPDQGQTVGWKEAAVNSVPNVLVGAILFLGRNGLGSLWGKVSSFWHVGEDAG